MTPYTVYALSSCQKKYIYVGMTNNLARRIAEHNNGFNKTTKPYAPFTIIYQEELPDRIQARIREKYLKSGIGKAFLKSLITS
jgi:putative endonuclease